MTRTHRLTWTNPHFASSATTGCELVNAAAWRPSHPSNFSELALGCRHDRTHRRPINRHLHHALDGFGRGERANFQLFASQLCRLLGVAEPAPAVEDASLNDYTFERAVKFKEPDGTSSDGRIDLYKRSAFIMEAKQSREKGRPKELALAGQPDLFVPDTQPRGQRSASRAWDQLMISARRQAEDYAKALPESHGWPPFVLVCDVGHCIEVYADFTG